MGNRKSSKFYPSGSKFDIQHSMSCKKGGFESIRHNDFYNLTARILSEVCKDRAKIITSLCGEKLHGRTTNRLNEERLDIRVRGFWNSSQQAFFNIRVFDPNACRYLNKSLQQCHTMN